MALVVTAIRGLAIDDGNQTGVFFVRIRITRENLHIAADKRA
jgi:hypothetical protein